jgi:hypothetical protein
VRWYSDLVREWAVYGTTDASSRERQTVLERIRGVSLRLQAIEPRVADAAEDVTTFDAQPVAPTTHPPGRTILVVQAAGKGVPMVQPSPVAPPGRLGQGQQRTPKKEAVVTSLYTVAP